MYTPWEADDVSFPRDLFRSWMDVMQRPGEFFRSLNPHAGFARPLIFYLVFSVLGAAGSTLSWMAVFGDRYGEIYAMQGLEGFALDAYMWMSFFFSPFWALFALVVYVGITHVGVLLFVPDRKPLGVTAKALCYMAAPAVLGLVPIVGWAVSGFWVLYLAIVGVQVLHETSFGRALAAVLVPPVTLLFVFMVLGILLAIMMAVSIGGVV